MEYTHVTPEYAARLDALAERLRLDRLAKSLGSEATEQLVLLTVEEVS